MVIKEVKGKQKMVMQGVMKLLKYLIPLSPSSFCFISSSQPGDSQSFSGFSGFLVPHVPLWGVFFLWGWCIFVNSCCQGLFVSSLVLFWLSKWEHFVQGFFFLIYVGSWEVGFFFFLKLGIFRQIHVRTNCCWVAFNLVQKWRSYNMPAAKGCRLYRSSVFL